MCDSIIIPVVPSSMYFYSYICCRSMPDSDNFALFADVCILVWKRTTWPKFINVWFLSLSMWDSEVPCAVFKAFAVYVCILIIMPRLYRDLVDWLWSTFWGRVDSCELVLSINSWSDLRTVLLCMFGSYYFSSSQFLLIFVPGYTAFIGFSIETVRLSEISTCLTVSSLLVCSFTVLWSWDVSSRQVTVNRFVLNSWPCLWDDLSFLIFIYLWGSVDVLHELVFGINQPMFTCCMLFSLSVPLSRLILRNLIGLVLSLDLPGRFNFKSISVCMECNEQDQQGRICNRYLLWVYEMLAYVEHLYMLSSFFESFFVIFFCLWL